MAVTVGELKGYWKKVADAVSSNKMNVTDTDILAALMAIGQTIEDVEAEIRAIKNTDGIKKIADTVDVQLTGSIVTQDGEALRVRQAGRKQQIDTLLSAVSVPAGSFTTNIDFAVTDESEIWIAVNIDKAPWTIRTRNVFNSLFTDGVYPSRTAEAETFPLANNPAVSLYLGVNVATQGLTPPATLTEAKAIAKSFSPHDLMRIRIDNESTETATVTVRIIRIWR